MHPNLGGGQASGTGGSATFLILIALRASDAHVCS